MHLADEAEIDEGGAQLAAGVALLLQGELQLIIRDDPLLYQQVAEAHFQSGLCHANSKKVIPAARQGASCAIRCSSQRVEASPRFPCNWALR
ncbi:hypothetical protein D3C75_998660 [compost metagenome]